MEALKKVLEAGLKAIQEAEDLPLLNEVRNEFLSKRGKVASLMSQLRELSPEQKREFGQQVNRIKVELQQAFEAQLSNVEAAVLKLKLESEKLNLELPGVDFRVPLRHPLTIVQEEIEDHFMAMGYEVIEGPEVELDFYNFERANIPANHPARDMQDTFYIDESLLLRTHTTAIQTRALEANAHKETLKVICPGKVYRKDDDDATHSHQFVQVEGLVVGHGVNLANLKHTLLSLAQAMFGADRNIRLRPSYFQFTEPSVEVDVSCHVCDGAGCHVCKQTGWIEILGAGMVHPHVLEMAGFDSEAVSGFAFGCGVERIAMLKYNLDDIRHFYQNDSKFLKQFNRFE
ncbi:MAG: phenylalanine--tRNA ligase subunit alpha [Erysipelothrix sp.]|jgi:phenylalanyl-tRNA synthetase alpha chain|nr:phenylalanine--tRNA ligase subunit alpha [Erysipelothrix sp.]